MIDSILFKQLIVQLLFIVKFFLFNIDALRLDMFLLIIIISILVLEKNMFTIRPAIAACLVTCRQQPVNQLLGAFDFMRFFIALT